MFGGALESKRIEKGWTEASQEGGTYRRGAAGSPAPLVRRAEVSKSLRGSTGKQRRQQSPWSDGA